ncbi:heparinase II/III family protein [Candidatus Poribacteria bacterium]
MLNTLRKEHPRLIALDSDVEQVKKLIETNSDASSLYNRLKRDAEKIIGEPPVEYKLAGPRLLGVSRRCLDRVYKLATLYRLDGDRKYLDRVKKELMAAAGFKDWHPEHFLDTAEMTHALAIGYDWLYDDLTDEERKIFREAIIQKGLKPAQEAYEGTQRWKWWVTCRHNWNQVCNGGIALGALAIAEEEPELCEYILEQAFKSFPLAMAEYAPDGGWPEGPGYWHYATRYTVYFLAGLKTALGTDMGFSSSTGFPESGMFRIHFAGPTDMTFNFADAGSGAGSAEEMFWMAQEFDQPLYAWHQRHYLRRANALNLWWFDPSGESPEGLPLDAMFEGVDVAFFHSAWEDTDAIFVGFKGGDNKANHSHLDLGTFVLDALGERWAVDLGGDNYNLPAYFGQNRWTYYRLKTEGHNVLTLDGANQDPRAEAPIIAFGSTPERAFAVADLSAAYAKEAKRVRRGVAMLDRSRVVVQDEVEAPEPVSVVWGFHTGAEIDIQGRVAVLTQDDAHLAIQIVEPADAAFKVVSAQPPEPQAQNEGISNLTIQLPQKVKETRIVVEITPYSGQKPASNVMQVRPLEEWTE